MIFVYVNSSLIKNYIYVGQSNHVIQRFHENNKGFEKTTRPYLPFLLIYSKIFKTGNR